MPPSRCTLICGLLVGVASGVLRRSPTHQEVSTECAWAARLASLDKQGRHQHCDGSGFDSGRSNKAFRRVALVVRGESFRRGLGQYDRNDSISNRSWEQQRVASRSHVEHVIEPIERCGFKVDVFVITYQHDGDDAGHNATCDLISFYGPRVVGTVLVPRESKALYRQAGMYNESLRTVSAYHRSQNVTYDAIFLTRHDIVFKQSLVALPNVEWEKVLLAFAGHSLTPGRSSDVMQWVPWTYANCVANAGFRDHENWNDIGAFVGKERMGFLLAGEHDSNTNKEQNALYRMVRAEKAAAVGWSAPMRDRLAAAANRVAPVRSGSVWPNSVAVRAGSSS